MERGNPKSALYLMECVFETDTCQILIQGDLGGGTITSRVVTPVQDLIMQLAIDQAKSSAFQTKKSQFTVLTGIAESTIQICLNRINYREHRSMETNAASAAGKGMAMLIFLSRYIL